MLLAGKEAYEQNRTHFETNLAAQPCNFYKCRKTEHNGANNDKNKSPKSNNSKPFLRHT